MSSYDKIVKLACKPKNAPPKSKYIESIIAATWSDDGAVSDVCKALAPRFREPNSIVVFKGLIVLHTMIRRGATDNVLAHLSQSDTLKLRNVYSANWEGFQNPDHLHHYAKYLDCRIRAYRDLQHDVIKVQSESNRDLRNSSALDEEQGYKKKGKQGNSGSGNASLSRSKTMMGRKLRSMTVEKGLLRETKVVHQMIDTVVECRFYLDGVDDELRLEALQMLVRDLLILFQAGNEAVINLLEQYFEMSRVDAAEALSIYRHFCKQTEHVTEYLGVAKKLQNLLNVPIPNLRHAPLSLVAALQEYLDDPNFEQNRKDYKANRVAGDGKGTSRSSANNAKTASSSKPDTKPATTLTSGAAQPTTSAAPSSQDQAKKPIKAEDFFNSIEENQAKMFNSPGSSPTTLPQTAPNPFAPMITGQPFAIPQITTQPTGFLMPQHTAMPNATNPFGIPGQQQPLSVPGQPFPPFLTAPDQQNFLRPQPTGPNPFRQSMLVPQSTGMALFGVGNNPGMGYGLPQQQQNPNPFSASAQPMQPMATGFGQSLFNTATPQQPHLQSQQTQPFQPAPSATPMGLSNSAFATTTQTQSNFNIPQRPASTPLTTFGSAAKSSSPPPALPLKPHMTGTKNPFGPIVTPAPPVPKLPTMAELATGFGGAGSTPFGSTPQQQRSPQQQQSGQPGQTTNGPTGGFNYANSALNPGGTDMGSVASSFAFAIAKSPGGTPSATSPTSSTTTGSNFSPSLFGGSSGLTSQSTMSDGMGTPTCTDPASLKPQITGFAGLKPFKPTSSFGAALMESLPPLPNQSGQASPPSTTGFSASTIGPGAGGSSPSVLGTSEFGALNKQQTGFSGTFGGFGALNTGANGSSAGFPTSPTSSVGNATTSRLGVGLRPQLTGGGAANPFRASMAGANSAGGFGNGTPPSVPPLPTGFGSGNMFGSMPPSMNNSFGAFGQQQQGRQQQGQQQQGNVSLI